MQMDLLLWQNALTFHSLASTTVVCGIWLGIHSSPSFCILCFLSVKASSVNFGDNKTDGYSANGLRDIQGWECSGVFIRGFMGLLVQLSIRGLQPFSFSRGWSPLLLQIECFLKRHLVLLRWLSDWLVGDWMVTDWVSERFVKSFISSVIFVCVCFVS